MRKYSALATVSTNPLESRNCTLNCKSCPSSSQSQAAMAVLAVWVVQVAPAALAVVRALAVSAREPQLGGRGNRNQHSLRVGAPDNQTMPLPPVHVARLPCSPGSLMSHTPYRSGGMPPRLARCVCNHQIHQGF